MCNPTRQKAALGQGAIALAGSVAIVASSPEPLIVGVALLVCATLVAAYAFVVEISLRGKENIPDHSRIHHMFRSVGLTFKGLAGYLLLSVALQGVQWCIAAGGSLAPHARTLFIIGSICQPLLAGLVASGMGILLGKALGMLAAGSPRLSALYREGLRGLLPQFNS